VLSDSELSLNTTSRNQLFTKCGFTKLAKKVKWNGEAHTIWVKGCSSLEPGQVRKILDKTVHESVGDSESLEFDGKGSDVDDLF
jgi:hypothetical protein